MQSRRGAGWHLLCGAVARRLLRKDPPPPGRPAQRLKRGDYHASPLISGAQASAPHCPHPPVISTLSATYLCPPPKKP